MGRKRSERVCHVVNTKEYGEQAIRSGPWDFAVVDIGVQKLMFNLVLKALHSRPEARHDDRVIDRRSTVAKVVGLDVALIISGCQEVNVVGAIAGGRARVWRIA